MRTLMLFCAMLFVAATALAQESQEASSYTLNTGDHVQVFVFEEPDLSIDAVLDDTGAISYPLLGELKVRGLTARELETKITEGLRGRFPESRLIAIFEPRTLTAGRAFLHQRYVQALGVADHVLLAPVFHHLRLPDSERLDLDRLQADLEASGTPTTLGDDVDSLLALALAEARPGDVFITMSSGSFEGLPHRLYAALD